MGLDFLMLIFLLDVLTDKVVVFFYFVYFFRISNSFSMSLYETFFIELTGHGSNNFRNMKNQKLFNLELVIQHKSIVLTLFPNSYYISWSDAILDAVFNVCLFDFFLFGLKFVIFVGFSLLFVDLV